MRSIVYLLSIAFSCLTSFCHCHYFVTKMSTHNASILPSCKRHRLGIKQHTALRQFPPVLRLDYYRRDEQRGLLHSSNYHMKVVRVYFHFYVSILCSSVHSRDFVPIKSSLHDEVRLSLLKCFCLFLSASLHLSCSYQWIEVSKKDPHASRQYWSFVKTLILVFLFPPIFCTRVWPGDELRINAFSRQTLSLARTGGIQRAASN